MHDFTKYFEHRRRHLVFNENEEDICDTFKKKEKINNTNKSHKREYVSNNFLEEENEKKEKNASAIQNTEAEKTYFLTTPRNEDCNYQRTTSNFRTLKEKESKIDKKMENRPSSAFSTKNGFGCSAYNNFCFSFTSSSANSSSLAPSIYDIEKKRKANKFYNSIHNKANSEKKESNFFDVNNDFFFLRINKNGFQQDMANNEKNIEGINKMERGVEVQNAGRKEDIRGVNLRSERIGIGKDLCLADLLDKNNFNEESSNTEFIYNNIGNDYKKYFEHQKQLNKSIISFDSISNLSKNVNIPLIDFGKSNLKVSQMLFSSSELKKIKYKNFSSDFGDEESHQDIIATAIPLSVSKQFSISSNRLVRWSQSKYQTIEQNKNNSLSLRHYLSGVNKEGNNRFTFNYSNLFVSKKKTNKINSGKNITKKDREITIKKKSNALASKNILQQSLSLRDSIYPNVGTVKIYQKQIPVHVKRLYESLMKQPMIVSNDDTENDEQDENL